MQRSKELCTHLGRWTYLQTLRKIPSFLYDSEGIEVRLEQRQNAWAGWCLFEGGRVFQNFISEVGVYDYLNSYESSNIFPRFAAKEVRHTSFGLHFLVMEFRSIFIKILKCIKIWIKLKVTSF